MISFNFTASSRKQLIKHNFPAQLKQMANANDLLPLDSKSFEFPTRIGLLGTWILITWENGDPYIRPISRFCELSIIPFRFTKRAFPFLPPVISWRPATGGEGFRGEKRTRRGGFRSLGNSVNRTKGWENTSRGSIVMLIRSKSCMSFSFWRNCFFFLLFFFLRWIYFLSFLFNYEVLFQDENENGKMVRIGSGNILRFKGFYFFFRLNLFFNSFRG